MADEYKPLNASVQCSDEMLGEVELQACRLFEEFLLLPEPGVCRLSGFNSPEVADSPRYGLNKLSRNAEREESFEDDMVPDGDVVSKSTAKAAVDNGLRPSPQAGGDQNLKDLAIKMRTAGDQLMQDYQYGERASGIEYTLLNVISRGATDLTYQAFSNEVDKLIGQDRTWTNLVLAYYVGKRVVKQVKGVQNYFNQYISRSYTPVFQRAGGVEPFVNSHMPQ